MFAAANAEDPLVLTFLLEAGAHINARDREGRTALTFVALYNQNPAILTALLAAGAEE